MAIPVFKKHTHDIGWSQVSGILESVSGSLTTAESKYINSCLSSTNYQPTLHDLWMYLDEAWLSCNCNYSADEEAFIKFYNHPVWILNWLFSECDQESILHRKDFAIMVANYDPKRVADFGGGFGSLARQVGLMLPNSNIEVIEPYPHHSALILATKQANVSYKPEFSGSYEMILAIDVFEHIKDPLRVVAAAAKHLILGGHFTIANCFSPAILCHLPSTFHHQISWDLEMAALGLKKQANVSYGQVYRKEHEGSLAAAYNIEKYAMKIFSNLSWMPLGRTRVGRLALHTIVNGLGK
jgi:hypothetical protein